MTGGVIDPQAAADHLEDVLGIRFNDLELLESALTHPSYASEHSRCSDYQRLEFLGDAVLELAVSHYIYEEYPDATEGEMTLLRAAVVSSGAAKTCRVGATSTRFSPTWSNRCSPLYSSMRDSTAPNRSCATIGPR